jgi:signal transduction histidine kinase
LTRPDPDAGLAITPGAVGAAITMPSAPAAEWGRTTLRQLVLLIAAFAVINVAIVLGIATLAARNEDEHARAQSVELARSAVAAALRDLGHTVRSYAWFDDAVERLFVAPDAEWAASYVGAAITRTVGVDRVVVLDGQDRPVFFFVDGQPAPTDQVDLPVPAMAALARRARATAAEHPSPATDLVMFGDMLRIAAAGALIYEKPEAAAGQRARGVMIITVPVKSELLARIAADFLLDGLVCVMPETPTVGPSLVLAAADGTPLAKLTWPRPTAGGTLLSQLVPALAATLGCSFIVIAVIYLRLQRIAGERQRQAGAMAAQTSLLRTIFETVNQAICVFDRSGRLLAFNRRYAEIYDLPPALARIGVELDQIVRYLAARGEYGPGDPERIADQLIRRGEDEELRVLDRVRPDGTALEIRRMPMPGGGFVITISDVTRRLKTEAELRLARDQAETASRAKSSFLANIGHELRTPLNAILGFSEIIQKQTLGPVGTPQYSEYAADIHESGLYLLEIINDILDLSKIEAGRMELHEQQVDLARTVATVIRLCAERALAGGITVSAALGGGPPPLHADERAVKQILVNLLSNAVKFTPQGGQVTIGCRVEVDGRLALFVADTGIGIAAKDMAIVLAPFGQVDSSHNRRYPGTGLGLPLVKSLAELHGGELVLESKVGQGTTATVRLPAWRVLKQE